MPCIMHIVNWIPYHFVVIKIYLIIKILCPNSNYYGNRNKVTILNKGVILSLEMGFLCIYNDSHSLTDWLIYWFNFNWVFILRLGQSVLIFFSYWIFRCGHTHVLMSSLILTQLQEVEEVRQRRRKCLKHSLGQWILTL